MPQKAINEREHIYHALKAQYPNKSKDELESMSYAIEQERWKKKTGHPAFVGKD